MGYTTAMEAAVPGSVLNGGEAGRMTSIKPRLGSGLAAGCDGPANDIAPQPQLTGGVRLDDRVGYRFAALLQPHFAASLPTETLEHLASREIVVVADDAPEQKAWLQRIEAPAVLVRPDRYVLGAARSVQELNSLAAAV